GPTCPDGMVALKPKRLPRVATWPREPFPVGSGAARARRETCWAAMLGGERGARTWGFLGNPGSGALSAPTAGPRTGSCRTPPAAERGQLGARALGVAGGSERGVGGDRALEMAAGLVVAPQPARQHPEVTRHGPATREGVLDDGDAVRVRREPLVERGGGAAIVEADRELRQEARRDEEVRRALDRLEAVAGQRPERALRPLDAPALGVEQPEEGGCSGNARAVGIDPGERFRREALELVEALLLPQQRGELCAMPGKRVGIARSATRGERLVDRKPRLGEAPFEQRPHGAPAQRKALEAQHPLLARDALGGRDVVLGALEISRF